MFKIPAGDQIWEISSPQVMGILNITADSFYKESRFSDIELAVAQALLFQEQGASIIDIGGQSTRPGATLITPEIEAKNIIPFIKAIKKALPKMLISIDTYNALVAQEALEAGANIINDISCGNFDNSMLKVVAEFNAGYIGMHLTGNFQTMHEIEARKSIMETEQLYFENKKRELATYGINNWVIDPGFGFGKTVEENFTLVKQLGNLRNLGLPILLGVSRKSSIYKTLGISPSEALNGTTIVNTIGLLNGASIIRVHDVKEAKEIIQLLPLLT
jgi:dihydropteroate synthase